MDWFNEGRLAGVSGDQLEAFRRDGFLIFKQILTPNAVAELRGAFPRLFAGQFETGIYPDEWYWREGLSLPDATRHMANAWKSDLVIARLVLSKEIAFIAASLAGWNGARLGQDTIWWKVKGSKSVALHQDSSFMDFLDPPSTVTCWVTLDDTSREAGTLEYVPGSHLWPLTPLPKDFHAAEDYRGQMLAAARATQTKASELRCVEVPAGSLVFHAGEIWHGSAGNESATKVRRSIGIHLLPQEVKFGSRPGGYIYRRYQRTDECSLDESFFPVLWSATQERTPWIANYLASGVRSAAFMSGH